MTGPQMDGQGGALPTDLDAIVWPTPNALVRATGSASPEELMAGIATQVLEPSEKCDLILSFPDDEEDWQTPKLMFGIEQPRLQSYQMLTFPACIGDIKTLIREHARLAVAFLKPHDDLVHDFDELLTFADAATPDDLCLWIQGQFEDTPMVWLGPFDWEDEAHTAGIEIAMNLDGSSSQAVIDFPFSVSQLKQYLLGRYLSLDEDLCRNRYVNYSYEIVRRFPFLGKEADEAAKQFTELAMSRGSTDAVKLSRQLLEWASGRVDELLGDLSPDVRAAMQLDRAQAVNDLANETYECAAQWLEAFPPTEAGNSGSDVLEAAATLARRVGIPSGQADRRLDRDFMDGPLAGRRKSESPLTAPTPELPRVAPSVESQTSRDNVQSASSSNDPALSLLANSPLGRRPHLLTSIVSALMLLLAPNEHPYSYYVVLRWIVCLSAILIVWVLFGWRSPENEDSGSGWQVGVLAFTAIAITFNPLVPITLDRATWAPIDFLAFFVFCVSILGISRPHQRALRPRG